MDDDEQLSDREKREIYRNLMVKKLDRLKRKKLELEKIEESIAKSKVSFAWPATC